MPAVGGSSPQVPRYGFNFLAKMLQAFLVLPAFAGAALVAGDRPLGRRVFDVVTAAATT